jgi:SAM-dependent methyltransferase
MNGKIMNLFTTETPKCKICLTSSLLYGVTDFNTSCYGSNVHRYNYPLSGYAIYYYRCPHCGLIYTHAFDGWSNDDFLTHIYNDEYVKYDPNFVSGRAEHNFKLLCSAFKDIKKIHALDFGCGDGQLVNLLKKAGVDITGWDPFNHASPMPDDTFEFITSFEVMEHTTDPVNTVATIGALLDEHRGKYFFSTLTNDLHQNELMNFWYIAPRNGHVTLYSEKSLDILFKTFGMRVKHISELYHLAYKCRE